MSEPRLALEWIPGRYAVCRLGGGGGELPAWARLSVGTVGLFVSVTRNQGELSVVAPDEVVPAALGDVERGWVALRVVGVLDFGLVGILARLTAPLAGAGVSVFCMSTYETDVLFVRDQDAGRAVEALRGVGRFVE